MAVFMACVESSSLRTVSFRDHRGQHSGSGAKTGRDQPGRVAAIIPERWPRSNRNRGRDAPEYASIPLTLAVTTKLGNIALAFAPSGTSEKNPLSLPVVARGAAMSDREIASFTYATTFLTYAQ